MGLFKRAAGHADEISPPSSSLERAGDKEVQTEYMETATGADPESKWKVSKAGDGDVAMALFNSPSEIHEPIDVRV